MKVRNFVMFFVILVIVAFTATNLAQAQERPVIHKVNVEDIGKPESGLTAFTDQAVIDRIVAKKTMSVARHLETAAVTTSTSPTVVRVAIIKDTASKIISLVGTMPEGVVVVNIFNFSSGKQMVLPALQVQQGGNFWIYLWDGNVPFFFGIAGNPEIQIRIFNPMTGDLTIVSSQLDFYSPYGGIREIQVADNTMKVKGQFANGTKVFLNYRDEVPEDAIAYTSEGMEINLSGLFSVYTGQPLLNAGPNLVTVVISGGWCDTLPYRYAPQ